MELISSLFGLFCEEAVTVPFGGGGGGVERDDETPFSNNLWSLEMEGKAQGLRLFEFWF